MVTSEATESKAGTKALTCAVCGETMKSEQYTLSAEEIRDAYIASCGSYSFDELARSADSLKGERIAIRGKVIQSISSSNNFDYRINVTEGRYTWSDTIYVTYTLPEGATRIIEDDIVTVYGEIEGFYTYTSTMGARITLPIVYAKYIEL